MLLFLLVFIFIVFSTVSLSPTSPYYIAVVAGGSRGRIVNVEVFLHSFFVKKGRKNDQDRHQHTSFQRKFGGKETSILLVLVNEAANGKDNFLWNNAVLQMLLLNKDLN